MQLCLENSYELINSHWPTAAQNPVLLFICVKRIPCLTKLLKRIILKAHRFKLKKYEEACSAFETGIQKDSNSFSMYLNYGNALAMSNR